MKSKKSNKSAKVLWSLFEIIIYQKLGFSGIVYLYRYKNLRNKFIAIKGITDTNSREIMLMSQLEHPNIVQYLGSIIIQDKHHLVMEYLSGGDLRKYLKNIDNVIFY